MKWEYNQYWGFLIIATSATTSKEGGGGRVGRIRKLLKPGFISGVAGVWESLGEGIKLGPLGSLRIAHTEVQHLVPILSPITTRANQP